MILQNFEAVVVGVSSGGLMALTELIPGLPNELPVAVIIVQHLHPSSNQFHIEHFNNLTPHLVKEAEDKESIQSGVIYFATPQYHLLVERDCSFSLSSEQRVCYSRPSIDVLFESAASAYGSKVMGIILTGSNSDGAKGLAMIKNYGGVTLVQDPKSAQASYMPQAALDTACADHMFDLEGMVTFLNS